MTPEEALFMRELRQLLKRHMVSLNDLAVWQGEEPAVTEWTFIGPEIELYAGTVAEELKQP